MEAIRRKEERKFFLRNPIDRFSSKRKRYTYAFARTVEVYRHPCTVTLKKRLRESGQFSTPIATFFSPDIPRYRSHNTGNSTTRLTSNRDPIFYSQDFPRKRTFFSITSLVSLLLFSDRNFVDGKEDSLDDLLYATRYRIARTRMFFTFLRWPWTSTSTTLDVVKK